MADWNQFDDFPGFDDLEPRDELAPTCAVCETMLPDAADGLLTAAEQRAFDKHVASCKECARELAEAQRGAAWLSMLKSQAPKPPESLLAKILAETTGVAEVAAAPVTTMPLPRFATASSAATHTPGGGWRGSWITLRRAVRETFSIESAQATFQPRIAMTAAMAFFSIALTITLLGGHLRDLRASDFSQSAIKRTLANVDASATRMFQNNRAVYQVESRLNELKSDDGGGDGDRSSTR